tara:strand:- start:57 stop:1004 length:948 start_codon:yes stop_codon:yes gene_type:complete
MQNVFEPARVDGKLVARNVATGEVAPESVIRYIMINQAEKTNQVLIVDTDTGRVKKLARTAKTQKAAEDASKMSFRSTLEKRDPKIMFENLERLTKMVGRGIQPSLVVTGMAGMGKTYIIKQTLTDMGLKESTDFVHFKGRATPAGLFITLYENDDKIIILDDCDSVFKDDDAVNILKAALDSYATRRISYITSKPLKDSYDQAVPRHFEFTGKIIFISNIAQSKLDEAVKSRSFVADISMNTTQMFVRMEQLMDKMETRIPIKAKQEALKYMKELNEEFAGVEINLRSFIKAARVAAMGFDNTKDMIAEQCIPV